MNNDNGANDTNDANDDGNMHNAGQPEMEMQELLHQRLECAQERQ